MIGLRLSAVDTLHFRDGTAFAASRSSPEHHSGQFPPHPPTVVGAVRAWLARGQDWRGGAWNPSLTRVLGDGHAEESLGQLQFDGPYVLRGHEPLFPMPAHVLGVLDDGRWRPTTLLRPGAPVRCDLGDAVRLPESQVSESQVSESQVSKSNDAKPKPGTGWWLTRAGIKAVAAGAKPDVGHVVGPRDLWHTELRVGIQRDDETRTVQEQMLYTSLHVRPHNGVGIGVRVGGVPDGWRERCDPVLALGGEGRLAYVEDWAGSAELEPPWEALDGKLTIIALTPVDIDEERCRPGARIIDTGNVTVVSACVPRVERIGGWAGDGKRGSPVALRSVLPAGTTFFCEIGDPAALRSAWQASDGLFGVGRWRRWGFGAVALGVWPTKKGSQ